MCEVQLCSREELFGGLCSFHRKKEIAGQLEYDGDLIWDTCSRGHRWTIENTHMESNSKGGRRRRCKACLGLKAERAKMEPVDIRTPDPLRAKTAKDQVIMDSHERLSVAIKPKCHGKFEQWSDYTAKNIPTKAQAEAMCSGCPLRGSCGNNAEASRPAWGVWDGQVWVYGQKFDETKRSLLHADD